MNTKNILQDDLEHILKHTGNIIEGFRNKNIFITGGTGFFGTWILETFAWANEQLNLNAKIVILTRDIEKFRKKAPHLVNNKSFSFLIGDVKKFEFPEQKFNYIVHAATDSSGELYNTNPILLFDTVVEGTRHIMKFAVKSKADNILYISSGAIYGKQPYDLSHIPEDYSGSPELTNLSSAYAEGKRSAEMLCTLYSNKYNLSIKIARCFAFVGPYLPLNKHFAIGNFILNLTEKQQIVINGDGTPTRSYLYASDLIIWLLTILVKGRSCYPYNVGSEEEISIENLAKLIAGFSKIPLDIKIRTKKSDSNKIERYIPSTKRAQKELNLKQIIDLKNSIHKTIRLMELLK